MKMIGEGAGEEMEGAGQQDSFKGKERSSKYMYSYGPSPAGVSTMARKVRCDGGGLVTSTNGARLSGDRCNNAEALFPNRLGPSWVLLGLK